MSTTIFEEGILPSKGLIYNKHFDPHIKIRSMTVEDEMKRLSPTTRPYKSLCDIIDDCLVTKLPVSSYDLCMGDYIYLLHKLRIATYGSNYAIQYRCPNCGNLEKTSISLDALKINEYEDSIKDLLEVKLPRSGKVVKLKFQTPRDLDDISEKSEEMKKKFPEMKTDPRIILTLLSFIDEIQGESMLTIQELVKKLPAMDYNILSQTATKLNEKVGIDIIVDLKCDKCQNDVKTVFCYTDEFFRPSVY